MAVTESKVLLPCPFCGGKARIKTDFYVYQFGERNVTRVWNRRVGK